ncbi:hypothetical protein D0Z07_0078 [Hyphodiscus hymeniophilus]|uniref:Meiotic recombination protein DMC1 n=1 Tax=Hyphodiscus hymeniophilus TaxID=353542 RepID=A0A9P7B0H9_9HELO|nr:hypothetical protein D0Z07_0078 [Hyphodiscus hymeniophilus]
MASPQPAGGFLPQNLPSPAPSNFSASPAPSKLPHPRPHPLKAGSAKEAAARRYVENRLLQISRRYTKKFQPRMEGDGKNELLGYDNASDLCMDLGETVDVLWLSGTPSLQIPSLLNIAGAVTSYISAFPPAPAATFGLLRKLDHAFVSLLRGEDSVTGEILPGFSNGNGGFSRTDMVRLKSLVEATRVLVVEVMSKVPTGEHDEPEESELETDGEMDLDGASTVVESNGMDAARVYAGTVVELGVLLPGNTAFDTGVTAGQS